MDHLVSFIGRCIDVIKFLSLIGDNFTSVIATLNPDELNLLSKNRFRDFVVAPKESLTSKLVFKLIDTLVKDQMKSQTNCGHLKGTTTNQIQHKV